MEDAKSNVSESDLDAMIAKIQGEQQARTPVAPQVTQMPAVPGMSTSSAPQVTVTAAPIQPAPVQVQPQPAQAIPVEPEPVAAETPEAPTPTIPESALDEIKNSALHDLRPLVDKLDLAPEDKFDTFLLLIRSSDDSSLIPEAYETARAIADDARRAQALLDIIREVDFFDHR